MKKVNLFFIVSIVFIMLLTACASNNDTNNDADNTESNQTASLEYQAEAINPDTDVCDICAMAIADDRHATQIVLKNDRSMKFDDLGCLYEWVEENGEDDIGAKFVRDFNTDEWILLEDASYIFDEEIETPMAYGIISFKDSSDAEKYMEENDLGELLTANDLDNHKWEMMDHDHDHGDHGHEDHTHGFHTEGFDMQFTELQNITKGKNLTLEVNITLDDAALEDAKVRYEIWKENDKESTNWVDTEEKSTGNYIADHIFEDSGLYHIQIHVENDNDLHEHMELEVNVEE